MRFGEASTAGGRGSLPLVGMEDILGSLHHVTATVDDAQADLDFATQLLGLRLVKKTVNFDNSGVYHFYYGDERGTPGTIWTTFPYRGKGVPPGVHGAGQITATSFSVPPGSLPFWKARFEARGVVPEDREPRFGEETFAVTDPSGLVFELRAASGDERPPWPNSGVEPEAAIRGLHAVALTVSDAKRTVRFLREVLGFLVVNEERDRSRLAVGGDGPGHVVEVVQAPNAVAARNGLGTVHHVAFAIADAREQLRVREELLRLGVQVTPVMDRQYFRSIYFREPGGVLYEIATVPPGFTIDEDVARLGTGLKLPPWEEPNRSEIEAMLPPVQVAR